MSPTDGARIARNTTYLVVSKTLVLAAGFLFSIVLARYLSVERFGIYAFAVSFLTIFAIFVKFGLRTLMIREISRNKASAPGYVRSAGAAQALLFAVALVGIWASVTWLEYPAHVRALIWLLSATVLIDGLGGALNATFSAFERMEYPATIAIVEKATFIAWGVGVIVAGRGLMAVGAGLLVSKALGLALAFGFARSALAAARHDRDPSEHVADERGTGAGGVGVRRLLRDASPFFLISVLSELYAEIDMTMLFSLQGGVAAGLYSAAFRLGRFPSYLSNAFHQAVYPLLARQAVDSPARLSETSRRSVRLLATVAVPISVGITATAEALLAASFGAEFVPAAPALRVLAWVTALQFLNPFFSRLLFALERQRIDARIHAAGVTVTIVSNMILIPRYGYLGAAWGSLLATALLFVLYLFVTSRELGAVAVAAALARPVFAGAAMFAAMTAIGPGIAAPLTGGVAAYIMALALLGGIPLDELRSLARIGAAARR